MSEEKQLPAEVPATQKPVGFGSLMQDTELRATEKIAMQQATVEVMMAHKRAIEYPRKISEKLEQIKELCDSIYFASDAIYVIENRGEGLKVGTAKAIAQIWGNMRTGIVEHGEYNGEMTQCESFATDLQNNFSFSDIFTAKHVRYSNNKGIEVLKKPDDISNAVKIQKSKSVRNSILSVIPDYVQDLVKKWCRQTMASEVKDVQEAFEGWIKLFAKAGVNADLLLRYVDVRTRKDLTAANIVDIRILFESIKEDPKVADKYFPGREKPKADAAGDSKVATEPPKSTKKTSASGSTQTQTSTASPSEQSTEPSAPQADAKKSAPATTTTEAPKSDSTSAEDTAASSQATPSAPASVTESKPTSNPKPAADANEQSDTSHSSASASESESSTEEQAADSAPAPSASGKAPIAFFRPRK